MRIDRATTVIRQNPIHLRFQQFRLSSPNQKFRDQNLILAYYYNDPLLILKGLHPKQIGRPCE